MAVVELGLSPQEFWSLTWYDWGMYVLRIHRMNQLRVSDRDFSKHLTRSFMALFANANRGSNSAPTHPEDFFKLSFEEIDTTTEERPLTFKEAKALLGSRIKKNGS